MDESDASSIIRQQQGLRHFVACRVLVDAGLSVIGIIFSPDSTCVCSVGWPMLVRCPSLTVNVST
jgi:hypothetical protein